MYESLNDTMFLSTFKSPQNFIKLGMFQETEMKYKMFLNTFHYDCHKIFIYKNILGGNWHILYYYYIQEISSYLCINNSLRAQTKKN